MYEGIDFYRVLEIDPTASNPEIARAYRHLVVRYHPDHDRGPGAEDRMKLINEAYAVLKDPERRRQHDLIRPATPPLPVRWQPPAQHGQQPTESASSFAPAVPSRASIKATILFCEAVDDLYNPIGIASVFSADLRRIICYIVWEDDLTVGTEVKVMWYVENQVLCDQQFHAPEAWDHVAATLVIKGGLPLGHWTVYVARDGRAVGEGRFVVRRSERACTNSWWKFWQRHNR